MRVPRRAAVAVAMAILVFVAPMGAAYALWTATSTATVDVTIAAPPVAVAPTNVSCSGTNALTVNLRWTSPPGPEPATYEVYEGTTVLAVTTHPTVTASLGQVQFAAAGQHTVGVRAVYPSGDRSTSNPTLLISKNNGQGGRISCA